MFIKILIFGIIYTLSGISCTPFLEIPKTVMLNKNARHVLRCSVEVKANKHNKLFWEYYLPLTDIYTHNSIGIYNGRQIITSLNIDNTKYYEIEYEDENPGFAGLVIKNVSENMAGLYRCTDGNTVSLTYADVIVILEKPRITETKISFNESIICCEVTYRGDIPPILTMHSDEDNYIPNLQISYAPNNHIEFCSMVTIQNNSIKFWCTAKPNITVNNIRNSPITWGNKDFFLNSDYLIIQDYKTNDANNTSLIVIIIVTVIICLLLLIFLIYYIKKKNLYRLIVPPNFFDRYNI